VTSEDNSPHPQVREDARTLIARAALLWAQARDATAAETRLEFERLALLYERLAMRTARREERGPALRDRLHADRTKPRVSEATWVALIRGVSNREYSAFQTLFLWTHGLVFTLLMRITNDGQAAERLALDVFHGIWREAREFDSGEDTVIGWIMNRTRRKALERASILQSDGALDASPVFSSVVDWPMDTLFSAPLWMRVVERITTRTAVDNAQPPGTSAAAYEVEWEKAAPGIFYKLLSIDAERGRLSMLVRLIAGGEYPAHAHAGAEQLHLLQGDLWIDDRRLHPGDYSRSEPGTADRRVWSQTGCTCILITSSGDIIG